MSYRTVQQALDAQLKAYATAETIAVAWPNMVFQPGEAEYLLPSLLPARPGAGSLGINGQDRLQGIYQVLVYSPSNAGPGPAMTRADEVATQFARGTNLSAGGDVVSCERAWPGPAFHSGGRFVVPVSVAWFSYQ